MGESSSKFRIIERGGSVYLAAIVLALIVTLALAASAQADDPVSGGPPAQTEAQESPAGQPSTEQAPGEAQAPAPAEGASEAEGAASGGSSEAPVVIPEESVPVSEEAAAVTTPEEQIVGPAPEETAPVEAQSDPPIATPEEPPATTIAPEEPVAAEVTSETRQGGTIEGAEELASKTPAGERTEGMGELDATAPRSALLETPVAALAAHTDASEGSAATGAILPVIATIAGTEVEGPGGGPPASGHGGASAAQRAGSFSCELSQLSGRLTDNCAAGWLGAPRFLSAAAPSTGLVTVASSLVAATIAGSPSEGGHGGSAVSSPPVGTAPSPAPGGAAGAATGAAGGFAPLSTFLTLAGLLLLGAPRVLRRLRLSCEPWLAGCFVLVPERPD